MKYPIKYLGQFILMILAIAVLLGLQYQYWLGENGRANYANLLQQIDEQQIINDKQRLDNRVLRADVSDLKTGLQAVEEHARLDLGLIKPGETFVQMSTAATTQSTSVQNANVPDAVESIPEPLTNQQ
ncbi:septum formation initiator family protein [Psychrobacter sp. HD31]|uniref:FtsB family cell division protein n=1 Tax=Psychrobacter sp. HD31 TaxID=3112003 RepID=UPI003DA5A9F8